MNFCHSAISAMECNIEYYIVLLLHASIIIIQQQKIILCCPPKGSSSIHFKSNWVSLKALYFAKDYSALTASGLCQDQYQILGWHRSGCTSQIISEQFRIICLKTLSSKVSEQHVCWWLLYLGEAYDRHSTEFKQFFNLFLN